MERDTNQEEQIQRTYDVISSVGMLNLALMTEYFGNPKLTILLSAEVYDQFERACAIDFAPITISDDPIEPGFWVSGVKIVPMTSAT